jgi:hypothetical protein
MNRRPSIRYDAVSFLNSHPRRSESQTRSSEDWIRSSIDQARLSMDRTRTSEGYFRPGSSHQRVSENRGRNSEKCGCISSRHLRPSENRGPSTNTNTETPRPIPCLKSSYTTYTISSKQDYTSTSTSKPEYTTSPSSIDSLLQGPNKSGLACGITRGLGVLSRGFSRLRVRVGLARVRGRERGRGRGCGHVGRRLRGVREYRGLQRRDLEDGDGDRDGQERDICDIEVEEEKRCFVYG